MTSESTFSTFLLKDSERYIVKIFKKRIKNSIFLGGSEIYSTFWNFYIYLTLSGYYNDRLPFEKGIYISKYKCINCSNFNIELKDNCDS